MALNDSAVLTAAVGHIFVGPAGTAAPAPSALSTLNLSDTSAWVPEGWTSVGHTSRGDMPEFGFEGGDSEIKGSWQKKKLKEVQTEDPIDYLTVHLQQFDLQSLGLYYGANASSTPGVFGVSASGNALQEKAFLVIIEDGDVRLGLHASKASVKRDSSIALPVDDFASLPIKATFLQHEDELLFSWISEDLLGAA